MRSINLSRIFGNARISFIAATLFVGTIALAGIVIGIAYVAPNCPASAGRPT